jgi:hypothetical protein
MDEKKIKKVKKTPDICCTSLIIIKKITILGTVEKKNVVVIIEPSYTSHIQKWNGTAPILNKKDAKIKIIPIIPNGVWKLNVFKNSKFIVPAEIYINTKPKSKIHEIILPKTKYFNPDSTEYSELR